MSTPATGTSVNPDFMYITRSALETLEQEARRRSAAAYAAGQEQSTVGGIFVGGKLDGPNQAHDVLIAVATGTDEEPVPHPGSLTPDAPEVQHHLQKQRANWARMDFLGGWYTVDKPDQTPSGYDTATAHMLLLDPDHHRDELVNALVWVEPNGDVTVRYYYMNQAMAEQNLPFNEFDSNRVYLIEDDDPIAANERAASGSTTAVSGAAAAAGTVAMGGADQDRMDEEFRRLAAQGYQVKMRQQDQGQQFAVMDDRLPGVTMYFIAPPGYPSVPPTLLIVEQGERVPIKEETITSRWVGDPAYAYPGQNYTYLVDIVNDVTQQLLNLSGEPAAAPAPAYEEPLPPDESQPLPTGNRYQPYIVGVIGVLALVLILLLGWLLFFRTPGEADYASIWEQVDTVLASASPSEAELQRAIDGLEQVLRSDPDGEIYERNDNVESTLTRLYVLLGNYYMNQEPPDLDAAEDAYLAALALSPDEPTALEGRQRVNDMRAEQAAESALQQTVEDVWRQVATTDDLADRVRLIEVLQLRGIETDPDGVPTSTRLYQAQMDLARQQFDNEQYQLARATAESALGNAPDDPARQEATNLLAQIYLAEGQRELDAGRLSAARTLFERVLALQPQPAPDFVNQAQAGLNEVAQQETQLDNLQRIEQAWQSYDAAVAREDWNAAIAALDSITEITGPTPETVDFPSPPYDPRTYNITETRAQVRLLEGTRLQRAGNFQAARAQFQAVQTEPGRITQTTREAAASAETRLDQARELWNQVNAARAEQDWQQMREALLQLSALEGFGAQARNPQDGQTVGDLLALADSNLNQPTAQPTAPDEPDEPTATSAPADTATSQPAATDAPAPTDLPTVEPLPTETATPEPPTATATPEPPTATATAEPTATATATEEEAIQYETYTHPSGLFSLDVPTTWDTNQRGGDGVRVEFVSPSDEYGVTVAIVDAPADATQADLPTLVQEFAQDEFGSEDNFSAETPATEADGSVSLSFTYESGGFLGGTTTVPGTILARLDGDKLSYRIVLFQGGEEAQTPETTNVVMTMTNSFQIDPAVPLP